MKVFVLIMCLSLGYGLMAQVQNAATKPKVNDFTDGLHKLPPAYKNPYKVIDTIEVKQVLDRVLGFVEAATPANVMNKKTKQIITDFNSIDTNSTLQQGIFRLTSYEWGVTYSGMLLAAKSTGDERYKNYVSTRFNFISKVASKFNEFNSKTTSDPLMRQVLHPKKLDDAGAICASMIKTELNGVSFDGRSLIDNYINFIMNKEYRLADGNFARNSPQKNTVWLDDMYMSVPAIVNMGKLTGDTKYYDEAVKQVLLFADKMFIKGKGLFRHGWVEGMTDHPSFHWGRANGWAILTMVEVLDVLPQNYPNRNKILALLQQHIRGLSALQSGEGFWHQLLDKNDSYLETSCTAIYAYCIAHAINKGWVDPLAYGPIATLAWNAVSTKVNQQGEVEGTCVGTGMAFDPAFYYYRPTNNYAAHGYGPVLLAGAEMIQLAKLFPAKMVDNAVQFTKGNTNVLQK